MPDLEQVCRRLFSDSAWPTKCLLGAVFMAVPILNFFAFGYLGRVVAHGREGSYLLPEWQDWRDLFITGLVFFAIFVVFAGGLFLAALVISLPFYAWSAWWSLFPWAALLKFFPFMPAMALAPPLVAAGWYRYSLSGQPLEAFRLLELWHLLRAAGFALVLPTLVYVGFLVVALPLFPLAFFVGGIVVFHFYSSIFSHAEARHPGSAGASFSTL